MTTPNYLIGESNDKAERMYLQASDTWSPDEHGWNLAIILKLDEGDNVEEVAYGDASATWVEIYYNCSDVTYALRGDTVFARDGSQREMNYFQPDELQFKPVPQQSYLTVAYQAACHVADPSALEQVGPFKIYDLINSDLARWKQSQAGQ